MVQFQAMNPNVEVNGQTVISVLEGMRSMSRTGLAILRDCGIDDPQPDEWYPQQSWLDAFKKIAEKIGPNTPRSIGKEIPKNAEFPPEIDDLEKALAAIDVAYHMNHRLAGVPLFNPQTGVMTEGIGHYHYKKIDDQLAELACDNPYPCDFDQGIIESMARKFKPSGTLFLKFGHNKSKGCRSQGDLACIYTVKW